MRLSLAGIEAAAKVLPPEFTGTPQYECRSLSDSLGASVVLKLETLNPIGCFKGRGTELAVDRAVSAGASSIICASAGNLGQAVAYSARARGLPATIVVADIASAAKVEKIKALGANVQTVVGDIEAARQHAAELADIEGHYRVEDSEDIGTCEGAGTIGLELLSLDEPLDAVIIALGGGAMATGIGCVIKQKSPHTQVICVQPVGAPAMTLSLRAGQVINTDSIDTIADGVAGRHPIPAVLNDLLEVVDETTLVEEASIVAGMRTLFEFAQLVVEPSAALGIAALLENRSTFRDKRVATIVCGANVSARKFTQLVAS